MLTWKEELAEAFAWAGSARQLAKRLGFSKATLLHWREGVHEPRPEGIERFRKNLARAKAGLEPAKGTRPKASLMRRRGLHDDDARAISGLLQTLMKKRGVRRLDVEQHLENVRTYAKQDMKDFCATLTAYFEVYLETRDQHR